MSGQHNLPRPACKVVISYSRKDAETAERLQKDLERHAVPTWRDVDEIHVGERWRLRIVSAINDCDVVLFLASTDANASEQVLTELLIAKDDYKKPILPVRLDDAPFEGELLHLLTGLHRLELRNRSWDENVQELLKALDHYGIASGSPRPVTRWERLRRRCSHLGVKAAAGAAAVLLALAAFGAWQYLWRPDYDATSLREQENAAVNAGRSANYGASGDSLRSNFEKEAGMVEQFATSGLETKDDQLQSRYHELKQTHAAKAAELAWRALELGDSVPAKKCLEPRPDPILRTAFVHASTPTDDARRQIDFDAVIEALRNRHSADASIYWALCMTLAAGDHSANESPPSKLVELVKTLYESAEDGATHSAARAALLRLTHVPPDDVRDKHHDGWFINGKGITMIEIPAVQSWVHKEVGGTNADLALDVPSDFYVSGREISVGQFREFFSDTHYAERSKAMHGAWWQRFRWKPPADSDAEAARPAREVNWYGAVLYCNWLNEQEGLDPCYEAPAADANGADVEWNESNDGYRLPGADEWEYACSAGSETLFCYGDDERLLPQYALYGQNDAASGPEAGGSRLPNAWGLFDMHGNVVEWCYDAGPGGAAKRWTRGGAFSSNPSQCASGYNYPPDRLKKAEFIDESLGFRVVVRRSAEKRGDRSE